MLLGNFEHILVRNVKLSLLEIHRSIATIVFIEREQTMLAVSANVTHEPRESLNHLRISPRFVCNTGRTHVHLELQTMKRMFPRAHLRIDESLRAANAETRDV